MVGQITSKKQLLELLAQLLEQCFSTKSILINRQISQLSLNLNYTFITKARAREWPLMFDKSSMMCPLLSSVDRGESFFALDCGLWSLRWSSQHAESIHSGAAAMRE